MILNPLEFPSISGFQESLGFSILEFELNMMVFRYFVEMELAQACDEMGIIGGKIWGYAPRDSLGSLIDFSAEQINQTRLRGYNIVKDGDPIDLCEWLQQTYKQYQPNRTIIDA